MLKKLVTTTAIATALGLTSLVATSAFASTTVTSAPEHYNEAVATWKSVPNVKCYNIYYGWVERKDKTNWKHSVRCVSNIATQYTIKGLKQSRHYEYKVATVNYSGKETSWTEVAHLVTTPQK